jgi:hypothetical protein
MVPVSSRTTSHASPTNSSSSQKMILQQSAKTGTVMLTDNVGIITTQLSSAQPSAPQLIMLSPTVGVRSSFNSQVSSDPARPDNHFDAYAYDRQKQNKSAVPALSPPIFINSKEINKALPIDIVCTKVQKPQTFL